LLLFLAILWVIMPFVIYRLYHEARKHTQLLTEQIEWTKNVCKLLDPDGTRYAAHTAHQNARAEAARRQTPARS
jgi:hypothetical protein